MPATLEQPVHDAIASVDDPCSIRANAPLSIFELGLVRAWTIGPGGDVSVTVSPTAPSCTLIGSIIEGIERRVAAIDGVRSVTVDLDTETFWTDRLMTPEGRRKLGGRRDGSMERVPVRPRQWQHASARGFELPVVTPR
jgi:metal-sulfur cluster biosynthetic enzyme